MLLDSTQQIFYIQYKIIFWLNTYIMIILHLTYGGSARVNRCLDILASTSLCMCIVQDHGHDHPH
jgi:hypothetical protein